MGDGIAMVGLIIFVCCAVSCILALLKWASPSGTSSSFLDLSVLKNWHPFNPNYINTVPETDGGASVYGFHEYHDFRADPSFKLGTAVSGKSTDDCSSLCQSTDGCRGFSTDGGCQLYNNVSILDRNKGSVTYASQDVGAVEYLHVAYGATSLPPEIAGSPFTGTLADTLGKCKHSSGSACKGFVFSGNTGKMYPAITAIDVTKTGDSYMNIDQPPKFIREGNYSYGTGSSSQWTAPASWLLTMNGASGLPNIPTNNTDWFAMWSTQPMFDAGTDGNGEAARAANTITVSSLTQCQNACIGNAWCQSFVYGGPGNSCYMRHDRRAQHFPSRCRSQASADACLDFDGCTQCCCPCGCDGYEGAHDGTTNTQYISYVKKLMPLDVSCPMSCDQDANCVLSTNDATTCNQYNDAPPPSARTPSSTLKATWRFDKYPN